ncbi:nuclear GTPase SLIP-GC-like [Odontesthes bonariensis]|uniref:nuclear GTPase SLIP-GC-like n=1 Tax=Odontesthes bonariensis TaxID=219752 RepID=UPI003F58F3FF
MDLQEAKLSAVKHIMEIVQQRLQKQNKTDLNVFLLKKIEDLETDKRELVGVFGKTGAGKSSLINAVIGEKNLLSLGSVSACTSVMIKVEANMSNTKYKAEIEFISEEEWKAELRSMCRFCRAKADQETDDDDDEYHDIDEKLSALYGDEWKQKSPENLMDNSYFREFPEFLQSRKKSLTGDTAKMLSDKLVTYTRNGTEQEESGEVKRWYWPLVKCVTIKVPNNDLLQHVTIVDLPGNGDCNKSRDEMWKEIVGDCSTVWIVTEINRAAANKESWEILKRAGSLIGNGGECQRIHFICTKSDDIGDFEDHSKAEVREHIVKRNEKAKAEVRKGFSNLTVIKKHFSGDCCKVFTVSTKEFLKGKLLNPEDTEIPKLQDFLKEMNDSKTLNYVSRAYGILSLIEGVILRKVKNGSSFHRTLRSVVEKGGVHKTTGGEQINLNMDLASYLMDSIDDEFRKTFPNEGKRGPFNGVINAFSLDTERLTEKYNEVELQLMFLKIEEEKTKQKINKIICDRKKKIYSSLTETIEESMRECYKRAATNTGAGSLKKMKKEIVSHLKNSMDMFERAKWVMLSQLSDLMIDILRILEETMKESIEHSLKMDDHSIPGVSNDLATVKKIYDVKRQQLKDLHKRKSSIN